MKKSLRSSFISGTFWTSGQQIIFTLLGLVQLSIVSHVLTPIDFGTYAVAIFFSSLGNIAFAMGFSAALIHKQEDIRPYLNTTWTASIGIALIASIVIICFVPLVCSNYFHNPSAIWPSIVIMFNGVFIAAANPGTIFYQKELELKKIFALNVFAKCFSFVLVLVFVYLIESYWGLILALLSESLFRLIYSYYLHPYRPKIQFNRKQFKELYSYSGWIQLKNITSWLASSIDTAVIGNLLGPTKLGFFNRSQTIASYPRLFVNTVIDSVAFPIYSKVKEEKEKMQIAFDKIQDCVLLIVGGLSILFASFGYQIINLVLGKQWLYMVDTFILLSVAYLFQTLFLSFIPVLRAFGYTRLEFIIYIVQIVFMAVLLYLLVGKYELIGAGIASIVCLSLIYPSMIFYVRKKTKLKIAHYIKSFFITLFGAGSVSVLCSLVDKTEHNFILWACEMLFTGLLYLLVIYLIWRVFKIGPGAILDNFKKD